MFFWRIISAKCGNSSRIQRKECDLKKEKIVHNIHIAGVKSFDSKDIAPLLTATMVFGMTGCGSKTEAPANDTSAASEATTETAVDSAADTAGGEAVTIKVFSNLPDRTSGQGLVEQTLFDEYMKENPNVTIEVEALDDEAYKTKFKAYAAGSQMPDLVSVWGQPGFIDEVIDAGVLAELNEADYADYGFINGSLEGFSKDGKLYGLPRNTDVMCFFYNQKMFDDNGWSVPQNYDELLALGEQINAAGIIPVAMDGGGHSVTANAANKEEAIKLLNYMYRPDGWTKVAWENGVCMSAQDFSAYATGNETEVQKQFMDMIAGATNMSGTPINDMGTSEFKTQCEDKTQELSIGSVSVEEYLTSLEEECAR